MRRYVNFAYKVAKRSTHRCHKMAAIIVKGGAVISHAYNVRGNTESTSGRVGHAEMRAILPHHDLRGATIIIIRLSGGCSRPCDDCFKAIQEAGIKRIGYINQDKQFVIDRV